MHDFDTKYALCVSQKKLLLPARFLFKLTFKASQVHNLSRQPGCKQGLVKPDQVFLLGMLYNPVREKDWERN